MTNWRDQKRRMRRGVHKAMCVPAYYIVRRGMAPVELSVRGPHFKRIVAGDLTGGETGYAQREDTQPRFILNNLELEEKQILPTRTGILSLLPGEAYRIELTLPLDDEEQIVECVRLSQSESNGLPVPEEC